MIRTAVIGGETHLSEITRLQGSVLDIVASSMNEDHRADALPDASVPNFDDIGEMLRETKPAMVAVSNENDLKFTAVMQALEAGCDVAVDKPLCFTLDEQDRLEGYLADHGERKLLNLLTLGKNAQSSRLTDSITHSRTLLNPSMDDYIASVGGKLAK